MLCFVVCWSDHAAQLLASSSRATQFSSLTECATSGAAAGQARRHGTAQPDTCCSGRTRERWVSSGPAPSRAVSASVVLRLPTQIFCRPPHWLWHLFTEGLGASKPCVHTARRLPSKVAMQWCGCLAPALLHGTPASCAAPRSYQWWSQHTTHRRALKQPGRCLLPLGFRGTASVTQAHAHPSQTAAR